MARVWLIACLVAVVTVTMPGRAAEEQRHPAAGLVIDVQPEARTFTASIETIAGVMEAMVMPFTVRDAAELEGVSRGAWIDFTYVVTPTSTWAERIAVSRVDSLGQQPLTARRLALIQEFTTGRAAPRLTPGSLVSDFRLVDQKNRPVSLSMFRGKVVAVNFTYTSCQLPDFCLRLVNHFGALQQRFARALGRDLVFLTISFDPARDQPDVLARYAEQWRADAETWRFLTGPVPEVRRALEQFDMAAFLNDGMVDHGLRLAVIDREGRLEALIEGNRHSTDQVGDLIASALARR